jgi:hypothetical protein
MFRNNPDHFSSKTGNGDPACRHHPEDGQQDWREAIAAPQQDQAEDGFGCRPAIA